MSLHADFVLALRRCTQRWRVRWDAELRDSGQTLGRARALMLVAQAGGAMPQRELALQLAVENPTLVRMLDRLEGQGMIRREPVPGNARANRIRLTEAAGPAVEAAEAASAALRARVLGGISRQDLETALRVLDAISEGLERMPPAEGTR